MNCTRKSLAALFLAAGAAFAQNPAPAGQDDAVALIRVNVNFVVVPVAVKDSVGRLVADLAREEFRILEDDVEQRIEVFSSEPFPLSVVVLVDNDLEARVADQVEQTLPALVGGFSANDEVLLARFDQTFKEGKGFTHDPDQLLTQLKRTRVGGSPPPAPAGGPLSGAPRINGRPAPGADQLPNSGIIIKGQVSKNVDDAVFAAATLLKDRGRDRRKIIILISDGANSRHNKVSFGDSVRSLLSAGISVYGIGVGNAYFNRRLTTLSKYARATAGDVFYGLKRGEIEQLYAGAFEQARNQYTLAYTPRGTDRSLEYHSIEVRVKRPGLYVQAREGYYSGGQ